MEFGLPDIKTALYATHESPLYYHIPKDILGEIAKCYDEMRLNVTVYIHRSGYILLTTYSKDTRLSQICDQFDAHDALINGLLHSCITKFTLGLLGVKSGDTIRLLDYSAAHDEV